MLLLSNPPFSKRIISFFCRRMNDPKMVRELFLNLATQPSLLKKYFGASAVEYVRNAAYAMAAERRSMEEIPKSLLIGKIDFGKQSRLLVIDTHSKSIIDCLRERAIGGGKTRTVSLKSNVKHNNNETIHTFVIRMKKRAVDSGRYIEVNDFVAIENLKITLLQSCGSLRDYLEDQGFCVEINKGNINHVFAEIVKKIKIDRRIATASELDKFFPLI